MSASVEIEGQQYEATIPDTLDLAERAGYAINALTGSVDAERGYEIYFVALLCARPPYMYHDTTGMPTNNPKYIEALPMMRVMSGSTLNLDIEQGMMNALLARIGEDGLYYALAGPDRPWHEGVQHIYARTGEDFANVHGNARVMLAMMAWYQRDGDPAWKKRIDGVAEGLARIAIRRDNYAYFPDCRVGEAFSYPRSGWKSTEEPGTEQEGAEGSVFMYHGGVIQALSRWYAMSGHQPSLELAGRLANFVRQPKFWGVKGEPEWIGGREHAHWQGHFCGHITALRGLMEYAMVTNNQRLKEFVRDGYEYTRTFGIPRIGWFPAWTGPLPNGGVYLLNEGCCTARIIALATKLSDAGVGDYWEDVDQYIRNQGVEQQLIRADLLERVSEAGPERPLGALWGAPNDPRFQRPGGETQVFPGQENADSVIERNIGAFANPGEVVLAPDTRAAGCCTSQGNQGLYYAWEGILRYRDGVAQVNLLLNRASPWLDVDSYLPYEGKVVLKNKGAKTLYLRIPNWVDKRTVRVHVNEREDSPPWLGNYLVLQPLGQRDVVIIEFSMVEETTTYTLYGREYRCYFKGNTLVDISPRQSFAGNEVSSYPFYLRDHYKQDVVPMKKVMRYVSPVVIQH